MGRLVGTDLPLPTLPARIYSSGLGGST